MAVSLVTPASDAAPIAAKAAVILEAARVMFVAQGYGATSMDAIAKQAGVSKATLYAHFAGKDELFAEMVRTHCRSVAVESAVMSVDTDDLRQGLLAFGRRFLRLVTSPEAIALHRVVVAESHRFPDLGRLFYDAGPSRVREWMANYLENANATGLLRVPDPNLAARQFIGMLKTDVYTHTLLGIAPAANDCGADALVASSVDLLLKGYAP